MAQSEATSKQKSAQKNKTVNAVVMAPLANSKSKAAQKPKIAMFIDIANTGISRENLLEVLFYINGKYQIASCRLYGYNQEEFPEIKEVAAEYNLQTIGKMQFAPVSGMCLDSRILVDAYECALKNARTVDLIFIWCYPCDLAGLFQKITELGVSTATIDNPLFDCKNKYVSQKIKIYSKYDFAPHEFSYGAVKNTKQEDMAPSEPTSAAKPVPSTVANANPQPQAATPSPTATAATGSQPPLETLDGAPIPVLPRREIPELTPRATNLNPGNFSNPSLNPLPNSPEQAMPTFNPSEKMADVIARNLNLPSIETIMDEADEPKVKKEPEEPEGSEISIYDIMKEIGLVPGEEEINSEPQEKKYEDTIGDL